jgi:tRNA 5-methylaminomethyl-2-thiouridine biosynthesis bifunctional protein
MMQWLDDGTPFSTAFQDVYYSRADGRAESEYVFLQHNALEQRWRALDDSPRTPFVIGETGFGTGLNFVLAWRLWLRAAPPNARLLFRSLEAHPLAPDDIRRALLCWPELRREAELLTAHLPPSLPGMHTLHFESGRITLQLYIGDVEEALDQFRDDCGDAQSGVDAWFLDGFSPARNPAMWNAAVMRRIAALSKTGATAATFTVAAAVRQALIEAGFTISKQPGFGRKRDMLSARYQPADTGSPAATRETPWHATAYPPAPLRTAIVIGAGIAGCCSALALARRGWRVTVLDAEAAAAQGASGNPQAALFTQLAVGDSDHGAFTVHSYLYALRFYGALLGDDPDAYQRCGLLQLYPPAHAKTWQSLRDRFAAYAALARFVDREEASALAGVRVAHPGLFLPGSGWIVPRAACLHALDHAAITTAFESRVVSLRGEAGLWQVCCENGSTLHAEIVVLANGHAAGTLIPEAKLPLAMVRGQLTRVPRELAGVAPQCVVSGEGYVIPAHNAHLICGATFDRHDADTSLREVDHRANLERLRELLPGCAPAENLVASATGRASLRCVTPDRLPIAGPVPLIESLEQRYAPLRFDARRIIAERADFRRGLYLSLGHGSRGMSSAPLCAELIAAHASGEPSPLPRQLMRALSPARFTLRRIIRGTPP